MKSTVPQTYPRYWSDVGNMGRGETFADSSDENGDFTGNSQYSFLPYCAGRGGVGECALRPWAATVDTDQETTARQWPSSESDSRSSARVVDLAV
jgi:hypothetical protein